MPFNTERELKAYIMNTFKKALNEVGRRTQEKLHNIVETEWYLARPESENYERTMQFIDSISLELNEHSNGFDVHVFFDTDKILPSTNVSGFGSHQSFGGETTYDGKNIGWWIVNFIESGIFPIRQDGYYVGNQPIDGIQMILKTALWLEDNLDNIMKPIFKKYGLPLIPIKF